MALAISIAGVIAVYSLTAGPWTQWLGRRSPADASPNSGKARPYSLKSAAGVYVTPRGQNYFGTQEIRHILATNGIDLSQQQRARWTYDAEKAFDLSQLPAGLAPYQSTLNTLRKELSNWLIGFRLANPKFHVIARNMGYASDDLDIGVHVDPVLTREWKNHGIAVIVEATLPSFRAHAQDICGYDSGNPMLGSCTLNSDAWKNCLHANAGYTEVCDRYNSGFAIYHPWIELSDSQALKISLPVRVEILPDGTLQLEALAPTTNLDQLKFTSGQSRDFLLPTVQLQVGSRTSTLDHAPIEAIIRQKEADLVRLGLHELQEMIVEQLPAEINAIAFDKLKQGFSVVKSISSPGSNSPDALQFEWGIRPGKVGLVDDLVFLDMDGYLTDPENIIETDPSPTQRNQPPKLMGRAKSDYDFALVVNNDIINRIIKLGFDRGSLARVSSGKDSQGNNEFVEIVEAAPIFSSGANGHGRLHLVARRNRSGFWQALAITDPFRVSLDLDVYLRLVPDQPNAFEIVIDHIDTTTAQVMPEDITRFASSVASNLQTELARMNQQFAAGTSLMTDANCLPSNISSLPLQLLQAEVDANGYLVFYMKYGDRR